MKKEHYCIECGEAPLPHKTARIVDEINTSLNRLLSPINRLFTRIETQVAHLPYEPSAVWALKKLAHFGIGKIAHSLDERDSIRTDALWRSAEKLGITLFQYRLFASSKDGIMVAEKNGVYRIYSITPRPKFWESTSYEWMDDKGHMKSKFLNAGLPVPDGKSCATLAQAIRTFRRVGPSVIAKPHKGSRGRHTTLHIDTEKELIRAFRIGKEISARVVIEKELSGTLYRVSIIGGVPVAVLRRDPPHVIGDGKSTVAELMKIANTDPRRDGFTFHPLLTNIRMERELARQHLTQESVPALGQMVSLNDKVSRLHGTTTVDVTNEVHPENYALFTKIGAFLNDAVVGIDFMIDDITVPHTGQKNYGVVECNAMPYLDLHLYPFEGEPRDVSVHLWKLIFPESLKA